MDELGVKRQIYGGILMIWVLLVAWRLAMTPFVQFILSSSEQVFWGLFMVGLPLLLIWGVHYQRRWSGWLGMVFGLLLILIGLRLIAAVLLEPRLPDLSLVILFPMIIAGGHLFTYSKVLFEWWWQGKRQDTDQ